MNVDDENTFLSLPLLFLLVHLRFYFDSEEKVRSVGGPNRGLCFVGLMMSYGTGFVVAHRCKIAVAKEEKIHPFAHDVGGSYSP